MNEKPKTKPQCAESIPETRIVTGSHIEEESPEEWGTTQVKGPDGEYHDETIMVKSATYKKIIDEDVIPAHQCPEESEGYSVHLVEEEVPGYLGIHRRIASKTPYCSRHMRTGRIDLLDGSVGNLGTLSLETLDGPIY